jgi:pimeloyl-ACP methyl ester carboxylesterase
MSLVSILKRAGIQYGPYIRWKRDLITELKTASNTVETEKGPIEYTICGTSGPYVSFMHGGPGGYDQADALFSGLFGNGFRILSWSRPGYINTPLNVGRTFEEQAEVFASLLNTLGISRTAVMAYSAGGVPAVHFATRHPDKIWALILECAVSQKYKINNYNMGELIFFSRLMFRSPHLWLADIIAKHAPLLLGWATIEMESSLEEDKVIKLMRDIMKDEQRVKILMDLIRSMSPAMLRKKGLKNDLKQLKMINNLPLEHVNTPTLVIHGTDDLDVPLEHGQRAARLIPNAEIYIVEKGFHILALSDAADEINEKRIMFLKTHVPQ